MFLLVLCKFSNKFCKICSAIVVRSSIWKGRIAESLLVDLFVNQGGHFSGIYRKVQLKPQKWAKVLREDVETEEERPTEALMVLKYGGVLTHAGGKQVCPQPQGG